MHDHEHDDPETLSEIEKLGYDPRDVPVEKTWIHAVLLYTGVGVTMVLSWLVMAYFDRAQVGKQSATEVVRPTSPTDPYPLLQSNATAKTDIVDLRHEEMLKSDTAGWVDKGKGVAHIPVENAKKIVLEELNQPQPSTPSIEIAPVGGGQ